MKKERECEALCTCKYVVLGWMVSSSIHGDVEFFYCNPLGV